MQTVAGTVTTNGQRILESRVYSPLRMYPKEEGWLHSYLKMINQSHVLVIILQDTLQSSDKAKDEGVSFIITWLVTIPCEQTKSTNMCHVTVLFGIQTKWLETKNKQQDNARQSILSQEYPVTNNWFGHILRSCYSWLLGLAVMYSTALIPSGNSQLW